MPPRRRGNGRPLFRDKTSISTEKPQIYKPRQTYPTLSRQPRLIPLRDMEISTFNLIIELQKLVRDGPIYTVMDLDARVHKKRELTGMRSLEYKSTQSGKDVSPFDAFPTYTQKYKKSQRPLPKIQGRVYAKPLFPIELHQYIGASYTPSLADTRKSRVKVSLVGGFEDEENLNEDEDIFMEEEDDDFEADEDEDDDYNAENYFSDGRSDREQEDGGNDEY